MKMTAQYMSNQQWMQHGLHQAEPFRYLPTDHRVYQHQQMVPAESAEQRMFYGQQQLNQPELAHYYMPQQQQRMPYTSTNNVASPPGYTRENPVDIAYLRQPWREHFPCQIQHKKNQQQQSIEDKSIFIDKFSAITYMEIHNMTTTILILCISILVIANSNIKHI